MGLPIPDIFQFPEHKNMGQQEKDKFQETLCCHENQCIKNIHNLKMNAEVASHIYFELKLNF